MVMQNENRQSENLALMRMVDISDKRDIFSRFQFLWAFVVLLCLAVYAMGANPFAGQTVAPLDLLMGCPGWSSIEGDHTFLNGQPNDIIDSQLPVWITLKDQIRTGKGALWYPFKSGGQTISVELYMPEFLLFLIIKNNALAYYLVGLAKLLISGLGCYLLLRTFLRWFPSIWGGVVFMLCGFNAAWFYWDHVATAMWIPWLLWATVSYLKTEEVKWLPAITIASLLLILGNFYAVAAFGFYSLSLLILVWNGYSLIGKNRRDAYKNTDTLKRLFRKTALPLLAVGIAFLMSAVALFSFVDDLSAINLGHRTGGGTSFNGIKDLLLFFSYEKPLTVERTAYIGIPVFLFALIGTVSGFRSKDGDLRRFIFFSASLVVLTVLIAFGLLPHELIRSLPVFNFNLWSRLIVVSLLGLSVLSAVGLDFFIAHAPAVADRFLKLTPFMAKGILTLVVAVIAVFQFYSQKALFNNYNAVVPSSWLYPMTPSIKYIKERIRPLQSVIADTGLVLSGSLGAYGIAEWYGHSFRTDEEKEVLGRLVHDPFRSATSAFILARNIQFNSPLMDKLAVKYLLVSKGELESKQMFALPELTDDLAPPLPGNSWRQHLSIPKDMSMGAMGFRFSTYGEAYAPADVQLTLYHGNNDMIVAQSELGKNAIGDNKWIYFGFQDRILLKKGDYSVVLSLPNYKGPGRLTAWATNTRKNAGSFLEINGKRTNSSLKWRIGYYEIADLGVLAERWNVIDTESNILLFENKRVTNSAYRVNSLDPSRDLLDFSGLDVKQISPHQIDIDYRKKEAGWIVLPMHLHSNWKAYVDDRPVKYDTYLGMLPAIPVDGASQVLFKYEQVFFRRGVIVSLAGVFVFLVLCWVCLKGKKSSPLSK